MSKNMEKTKDCNPLIIAGFPGVGKSFISKELGSQASDSDSSKFSKDEFPDNYIRHIKSLMCDKKIILVSTHKEVLDALEKNGVEYMLAYPKKELKPEYLQRYVDRGSPEAFVKLLDSKWDSFMDDIETASPKKRIILKKGEFLKDKIKIKKRGK